MTTTKRAVVYCRISDDRHGLGLGVERQRQDCEALVRAKGWTPVRTLIENDTSAYSGRPRKQYDRMVALIAAGQCDAVVAWHPDRLHRSPKELEGFIELVEQRGVVVETVQTGEWNLATSSGRLMARQLGSLARYESEHKAERVKRALAQNATDGRAHGRRAYGWDREYDPTTGRGRDVVNPREAAVVREIADRIIRGESLRGILTDLNERGIPSPTGKTWGKTTLRHIVTRERNAGLRVHHGQIVGEGDWEPILNRGTWDQVVALLRDPTRRTSTGSAAAHLLSGIARCGVCGGPMRAGMNRTVASYRCASKSCVSRNRADVDALVEGVVLARLSLPDAADLLAPDRSPERATATNEARELRARLDRAADDYADGKIDARQLERISTRMRPQLEAAEARARIVDDSPLLDGLVANEQAAEVWNNLPITRRRAVVDLLLEVRIDRTKGGARVFDPESVTIEWKA